MKRSLPAKSEVRLGRPDKELQVAISEAATILGVSIDTVRRWDKEGLLHSTRPNGKDRYYSVAELQRHKAAQPLSIAEAAEKLGLSQTTLRRLEKRGLIMPQRNKQGKRQYTKKSLDEFMESKYFMGQKTVQDQSSKPLKELVIASESEAIPTMERTPQGIADNDGELDKSLLTEAAADRRVEQVIMSTVVAQDRKSLNRLLAFQKMYSLAAALVVTSFVFIVAVLTFFFMLFPEDTADFFGYQPQSTYALNSQYLGKRNVLGATDGFKKSQEVSILGKMLKPFSKVALVVVKQIDEETHEKIVPRKLIGDVNEILTLDSDGNIVPRANLMIPDSSYLKMPEGNLVEELKTQLGGTVNKDSSVVTPNDQLAAVLDESVTSSNILDGTINASDLAFGAVGTLGLADGSITAAKLASGMLMLSGNAVVSSFIKDGEVKSEDILDGTVGSADLADGIAESKLSQISSANKVAGSAVQLATGGGFVNNSGLSLLQTCSDGQVLAWNASTSTWECATSATGTGDITAIIAGDGLTGDAASGDVTLDIGAGNGITIGSNSVAINLTASGSTGAVSSNSGLEVGSGGLTMLKGCADTELLKYTDAGGWACAADSGSTYSVGSDLDLTGSTFDLEPILDTVTTINLAGTGTLNGLDAVDNTTESTIEGAIDTLSNLTAASSLTSVGTLTSGATGTGFTVNFTDSTLSGNITGSNIDEATLSGLNTSNLASANVSQFTNNAGYITGNQAITLSGAVSGSGTTAITTTLANNAVTTDKIQDASITLAKIAQNSCSDDQIIKWNGTGWTCADDETGATGSFVSLNPSSADSAAGTNPGLWVNHGGSGSLVRLQNGGGTPVDRFVVSNSGVITTGGYQGAAIADTYINDNLTISASGSVDAAALTGTVASGRLTGTYGIDVSGNAATVTNGVYTSGSYADPSWITSLAGSKLTGNITGSNIDESTLAGLTTSNFTSSNVSQWTNNSGYLTTVDVSANTNLSASDGITLTGDALTNTDKGSSQNIFKTLAVSGQSNVVSDANSDTLTFAAGSNVTLATDASTDTITINATDTNTTYSAGNDLDLTGTTFDLESTIDTVSTINLTGTGTLNGLDAIDGTSESTIEGAIDTLGSLTSAASLATVGTLTGGATGTGFTLNFTDSTLSGNVTGTNIDESTLAGLATSNFTSANISQWTNNAGYITDGNTGWDNSYGFMTAASTDTLTNKSGAISQWTNDSGYLTSIDISANTNLSASDGITLTGDALTNSDKGSSQNIFKTYAVAGQSNVVTGSNSDTLTFVAGSNITLTTDASTDTITITGGGAGTTYSAGSDLDLNGTTFDLESTIDTVSTINLTGTGTLNGLDAIDATTESTIEGAIDTLGSLTSASSLATVGTLTGGATGTGFTLNLTDSTLLGDVTGSNIDESSLAGLDASNFSSDSVSQWTNDAGYIIDGNTGWNNSYGFITASSTDTLTNKSGNISQWTNNAGYLTTVDVSANTNLSASDGITLTGDALTNSDKGSSQNIFKTFAVSGQSNVVSDANGDSLTFVAGSNVTLTTDALTDTITFAATDTNTTYSAGSDLDLNGTTFDLESTIDTVSTINLSGTGTLNGLDAIDATTESTIEGAIDTLASLTSASSLATVGTLTGGATGTGFTVNFTDSTLSGNITGSNIDESSLSGLTTSNFSSANISQWTNDSGYLTAVDVSGNTNLSATNGITLTGDQLSLSSTTGGDGLTYTTGVLAVGAGTGITVAADSVSATLGTSIANTEIDNDAVDLDKVADGLTLDANLSFVSNSASNDYKVILDNSSTGDIAELFEVTTSGTGATIGTALDLSDADIAVLWRLVPMISLQVD